MACTLPATSPGAIGCCCAARSWATRSRKAPDLSRRGVVVEQALDGLAGPVLDHARRHRQRGRRAVGAGRLDAVGVRAGQPHQSAQQHQRQPTNENADIAPEFHALASTALFARRRPRRPRPRDPLLLGCPPDRRLVVGNGGQHAQPRSRSTSSAVRTRSSNVSSRNAKATPTAKATERCRTTVRERKRRVGAAGSCGGSMTCTSTWGRSSGDTYCQPMVWSTFRRSLPIRLVLRELGVVTVIRTTRCSLRSRTPLRSPQSRRGAVARLDKLVDVLGKLAGS